MIYCINNQIPLYMYTCTVYVHALNLFLCMFLSLSIFFDQCIAIIIIATSLLSILSAIFFKHSLIQQYSCSVFYY